MRKIILFVLMITIYECNGDLLQGILGGANEINRQIHGVAGAFLGGLSHGLNVQGSFGLNTHHTNEIQPEKPSDTTLVVIVNENNDAPPRGHQHRPQNQNRPQNYHPQENWNDNISNNFGRPNPPNYANTNQRPQNNQGQYNRPENGNGYVQNYGPHDNNGNQNNFRPPNRPNHGQNNNPGYENQNQNYQPGYGNQEQNNIRPSNIPNYNQNNRPGGENFNQNPEPNQWGIENSNNKNGQINIPEQGQNNRPIRPNQNNNIWTNPTEAEEVQHTTEKVVKNKKPIKDDEPLFVPLSPSEYVYGGDKIKVETPKRDTGNKSKPAEEDDELPIDIRFKED